MSDHHKISILSKELVRRLSNIHRDVVAVEIEGVIEQYIGQLKTSGYTRKQANEIVMCGVVGWRMEKAGQNQYLEAKETPEKRTEDKLLEKTTWYKGNQKRKLENMNSKNQYNPPAKKKRKSQQEQVLGMQKTEDKNKKVKAVMFMPYQTKRKQETTTTPKKTKTKREERQHKKARLNKDIKKYITCKRWREEKEEEETRNEKEKKKPTTREEKEQMSAKEEKQKGDNTKLPGGGGVVSRLDTTPPVCEEGLPWQYVKEDNKRGRYKAMDNI
jgi:hypothetical protein